MQMSHSRLATYLDRAAWAVLLVAVAVIPAAFDGRLINQFVLPKEYALGIATLIIIGLWVSKAILFRTITLQQTRFDRPIIFFLGASLVASIFSSNHHISFFGQTSFFSLHFIFLLFGALFFAAVVAYCRTSRQWQQFVDMFVGSGGLVTALFVIKTLFSVDILSAWLPNAWSIVDPATTIAAVFTLAVFLMASGQVMRKDITGWRVVCHSLTALLSFIALIIFNYGQLWWLVIAGLVLLLCVGTIFVREARLSWLSTLFALLLLSTVFVGFGAPQLSKNTVPAVVALSRSSSWYLVKASIFSHAKEAIIGNGLGTFGMVFSKFRDPNFNTDQQAWSLRFNQPHNTIDAIMVEGGLLAMAAVVFIFLLVIGVIATMIKKARQVAHEEAVIQFFVTIEEEKPAPFFGVIASSITWVMLTIGMFFFFYGVALWFAWWVTLGLLVVGVGLCDQKFIQSKEYNIEDAPEYTLSFSFVGILIVAAVLLVGVWGSRIYVAENKYAQSVRATSLGEAEQALLQTIAYGNSNENYHVALAQVYLLEAVEVSKLPHPDMEKIGLLTQQAVNEARTAAGLAPRAVAVWENLAVMYENAATLLPEAREWAIKALNEAIALEPTNPVLLTKLGNNLLVAGTVDEAITKYEQAIILKKDYVEAYRALASAYEQAVNIDKAINVRAVLASAAVRDYDNLFNYGRLLYNRNTKGDRDQAEKIWLQVVAEQPKYSNVLYSLGSLYEARGQKILAVNYYNRVLSLNPTNKDIKNKINALSK